MEDVTKKVKKKDYYYDPRKVSIIIVVGVFIMCVLLGMYNKSLNQYEVLTCRYNYEDKNFTETLRFYFNIDNGQIEKYYRDEMYTYEKSEEYDKIYEYLVDYKKKLGDFLKSDSLSYVIKKESDTEISVKTFIDVYQADRIFDEYMKVFDITHESDIRDVYNTYMANERYSCTVTEAK